MLCPSNFKSYFKHDFACHLCLIHPLAFFSSALLWVLDRDDVFITFGGCSRKGTIFLLPANCFWKAQVRMKKRRKWKQTSTNICHYVGCRVGDWKGWSEGMRHPCMNLFWLLYLITLFSLDVLSEGGHQLSEISPCLLAVLQLHMAPWNLCALFMLCILRTISNLIDVSLLLPAAAAPKIKSGPRKEMLGWSSLIDQMLCFSKPRSLSTIRSRKTIPDVQMLNIKYDYIVWTPEPCLICIFEHFPRANGL